MEIFMLDASIFDKITGKEGLKNQIVELENKRQIAILTTHIQTDELKCHARHYKEEKYSRMCQ